MIELNNPFVSRSKNLQQDKKVAFLGHKMYLLHPYMYIYERTIPDGND
jgi:hypothetical protein